MFESVILEKEQKDLFVELVEAARNTPRERREKFLFVEYMGGSVIHHAGLKENLVAYKSDIEFLGDARLLRVSLGNKGSISFDVTPFGFKYYEYLKQELGRPVERVEASIRQYMDSGAFQRKYPVAYAKWSEAEVILWASDSEKQLSTIGHLCREALQEFATALVERYNPPEVSHDKAKTVARMKAVLNMQGSMSRAVRPFVEALTAFWGTTCDLIQRQEHGGQKEGEPLAWEDGRRVVFSSMMVMSEIDRSLV